MGRTCQSSLGNVGADRRLLVHTLGGQAFDIKGHKAERRESERAVGAGRGEHAAGGPGAHWAPGPTPPPGPTASSVSMPLRGPPLGLR